MSSVSGEGIDQLKSFLSQLTTRISIQTNLIKAPSDKVEFLIDGSFTVKDVGLVLSGTLVSGTVNVGQLLQLGPDKKGDFKTVTVKSIHYKRSPVDEITSGN
ncbi:MAG: hypothetical protein ACKO96_29770, partial [Flammeovirgaceae bacterium]